MSDRYSARHGGRITPRQRRARSRRLGRLAATLTVAGLLVGGAGAVLRVTAAPATQTAAPSTYSLGSFADPERTADRADRGSARGTAAAPATGGKVVASGTCDVSFYDEPQGTASGEAFDPTALTAAHRTLPFDTRVRVTNPSTGKSVVVRINDRGPALEDRCLDLSAAAFSRIARASDGVVRVTFEVLAN
ncbi:hypothetical protein GCM10009682_19560 [Luedemannella flava]|uniref:Probable endolytic peptidoglycan transglycosylase RlpA n=1 Tax=Luedemannella flava TaxID=349316 RepID=A0ABP4XXY0_9ACTN